MKKQKKNWNDERKRKREKQGLETGSVHYRNKVQR